MAIPFSEMAIKARLLVGEQQVLHRLHHARRDGADASQHPADSDGSMRPTHLHRRSVHTAGILPPANGRLHLVSHAVQR